MTDPSPGPRAAWPRRLATPAVYLLALLAAPLVALVDLADDAQGRHGAVLTVGDDEVAVVHDLWSGAARQVDTPGKRFLLPYLQEARVLKRSAVPLVLAGDARTNCIEVPALELRAADGSRFRFERHHLTFTLLPDLAARCLEDTRAELDAAAGLVEAYARAVLRDEYGRYTADEVVLHENQKAAKARSLARLDAALRPHGLAVVELATPTPRFAEAHEEAVERRKVATQEVERLRAKAAQLAAEREEGFASLEKDKQAELAALELAITSYGAEARRAAQTRRDEAEQHLAARRSAGESRRFELEQQALALVDQHEAEAAALQAVVDEFAAGGELAVRAAWIERLAEVPFRLAPYARDAAPRGVELTEVPSLAAAGH